MFFPEGAYMCPLPDLLLIGFLMCAVLFFLFKMFYRFKKPIRYFITSNNLKISPYAYVTW